MQAIVFGLSLKLSLDEIDENKNKRCSFCNRLRIVCDNSIRRLPFQFITLIPIKKLKLMCIVINIFLHCIKNFA